MNNCPTCKSLNVRIGAADNLEVKRELACLLLQHQMARHPPRRYFEYETQPETESLAAWVKRGAK